MSQCFGAVGWVTWRP